MKKDKAVGGQNESGGGSVCRTDRALLLTLSQASLLVSISPALARPGHEIGFYNENPVCQQRGPEFCH